MSSIIKIASVAALVGATVAMPVLPETRVAGCNDKFSLVGDAFTKAYWTGPEGQAFCFRGDAPYFMVDGKCSEVALTCEERRAPAGRGPAVSSVPTLEDVIPSSTVNLKQTTTIRNLVLMIRFSDYNDTNTPPVEDMELLMNADEPDGRVVITESVKSFYTKQSQGKLELDNVLTGWIDVPFTEAEAAGPCVLDESLEVSDREDGYECCNGVCYSDPTFAAPLPEAQLQNAIMFALEAYEAQIGAEEFLKFDSDGDNNIDMFTVVHSAKGAESSGGNYIFKESIWSHKYYLNIKTYFDTGDYTPYTMPLSGLTISNYNVNPGQWHEGTYTETNEDVQIAHFAVIAHECGHFLGLPDLYDTDYSSLGLGAFCTMANSWGIDGTQNYPPSFSAPMKEQLGWLETIDLNVVEPGQSMEVTLDAVQLDNSAAIYRLSELEYIALENRQPIGIDRNLSGGILVFHVDLNVTSNSKEFNVDAPETWVEQHPYVRLIQPDGLYHLETWYSEYEGRYNTDTGDFFPFQDVSITDAAVPLPNLNTYAQLGQPSGLSLTNFVATDDGKVSFTFSVAAEPTEEPAEDSISDSAGLWIGIIAGVLGTVAMLWCGIKYFGPVEEDEVDVKGKPVTEDALNPKHGA